MCRLVGKRKTNLGGPGGLYPASVVGYGAEGWSSGGGVGGLLGVVLCGESVFVVFREPHRLPDFRHFGLVGFNRCVVDFIL